ncbi:unnamed protein product, partial [Closterium sp. NIES-53]
RRLQRRANHSRNSCGEGSSRRDNAPEGPLSRARAGSTPPLPAAPEAVPQGSARSGSAAPDPAPPDPAPPGSAPPGSAPPDPAPPGSAPPGAAPPDAAPPDSAHPGSAPLHAPESAATSTSSTASTWDTPKGAGP